MRDLGKDGVQGLEKMALGFGFMIKGRRRDFSTMQLQAVQVVDRATKNSAFLLENFAGLGLLPPFPQVVDSVAFFSQSPAIMSEYDLEMRYQPAPGDYQWFVRTALARREQACNWDPQTFYTTPRVEFFVHTEKVPILRDHHSGAVMHGVQMWKIPGNLRVTYGGEGNATCKVFCCYDKELVCAGTYGLGPKDTNWRWAHFAFQRGVRASAFLCHFL